MPLDPEPKEENKSSIFGVIVHSFFVVPFLLAIFSVLLFVAIRVLTLEKRNVYEYIEDVKVGGIAKRWQSAFELSRVLSDKANVPQDEKFISAMSAAYSGAVNDDERVRQYLAFAMAKSGRMEFADVLLKDIGNEKDENLYANIAALGILKAAKAVDPLIKFLDHPNVRIRLATVIALGNIGDPSAINALKGMLNDSEANVTWDAAVALAKMGDQSGKAILFNLLDRSYLSKFTEIDNQEQAKIIGIAIQVTSTWNDVRFKNRFKQLFENDKNMNVRMLAKKALGAAS